MTSCREREEFVHGAGVWLLAWPKRAGSHCFTPTRDLIQVVAAVYIKRLLVGAAVHRFVIQHKALTDMLMSDALIDSFFAQTI